MTSKDFLVISVHLPRWKIVKHPLWLRLSQSFLWGQDLPSFGRLAAQGTNHPVIIPGIYRTISCPGHPQQGWINRDWDGIDISNNFNDRFGWTLPSCPFCGQFNRESPFVHSNFIWWVFVGSTEHIHHANDEPMTGGHFTSQSQGSTPDLSQLHKRLRRGLVSSIVIP